MLGARPRSPSTTPPAGSSARTDRCSGPPRGPHRSLYPLMARGIRIGKYMAGWGRVSGAPQPAVVQLCSCLVTMLGHERPKREAADPYQAPGRPLGGVAGLPVGVVLAAL